MTRKLDHFEVGIPYRDGQGNYHCRFVKCHGRIRESLNQGNRYPCLEFQNREDAETFAAKHPRAEVIPVYLESFD